jgi:hypothetical protein
MGVTGKIEKTPSSAAECRLAQLRAPGMGLQVSNRGSRDRISEAFSGIGDGFDGRREK